jgi:glucose-1-phosphate adenylyltransferase
VLRPKVLAMVLAGGEGKRLHPLTRDRAKPAVPFGGNYRLIDFVLSNLVNGGFLRIVVLTQYKSHSLDRHIATTWRMSPLLGNYVTPVPAQMRRGPHWFAGSADAIYQNLNLIGDERPDYILVFGADHIYRMDPQQMLDQHVGSGAGVTVAGIRAPIEQAEQFGVIETEEDGLGIRAFREKPRDAVGLPDAPHEIFASMGNYVFTTRTLIEAVTQDATDPASAHDLGGNIIPMLVDGGEAQVYDFSRNVVPGATDRDRAYWRDVGTVDAYYDAHMDLVSVHPIFNLYNQHWPILSFQGPRPPAKFVFEEGQRVGHALDSMVCAGVVVSGGTVRRSVVSPDVFIHSYACVEDSVLMHGVDVGRHALVRRAIVDKHVRIPEGVQIGVDLEADRRRYTVTSCGVVVIGKGDRVPGPGEAVPGPGEAVPGPGEAVPGPGEAVAGRGEPGA